MSTLLHIQLHLENSWLSLCRLFLLYRTKKDPNVIGIFHHLPVIFQERNDEFSKCDQCLFWAEAMVQRNQFCYFDWCHWCHCGRARWRNFHFVPFSCQIWKIGRPQSQGENCKCPKKWKLRWLFKKKSQLPKADVVPKVDNFQLECKIFTFETILVLSQVWFCVATKFANLKKGLGQISKVPCPIGLESDKKSSMMRAEIFQLCFAFIARWSLQFRLWALLSWMSCAFK